MYENIFAGIQSSCDSYVDVDLPRLNTYTIGQEVEQYTTGKLVAVKC